MDDRDRAGLYRRRVAEDEQKARHRPVRIPQDLVLRADAVLVRPERGERAAGDPLRRRADRFRAGRRVRDVGGDEPVLEGAETAVARPGVGRQLDVVKTCNIGNVLRWMLS